MPDLGKQQSSVPILADSENENKSPCEDLTTQEPENESLIPEDLSQWWEKAKQSSWLPWAVAAGFGALWLQKGKNNQ